jgi:nitrite reductase/ring-hydroxylating ferredoxin subunit
MSEPKGRIRLCSAAEVKPGEMLGVDIDGLPKLAVYRVGDEFYCSQDLCTHGAASLSDEGDLDEYIVECTWHNGKFDVRTGKPCALPCTEPLRVFPVTLDGDDVFIDVE